MRKIIALICIVLGLNTLNAQNDTFERGDVVLNVGVGIINTLYTGNGYSTKIPTLAASLEYGLIDDLIDGNASIGVGGFLSYHKGKYKTVNQVIQSNTNITDWVLGLRGNFHYQFIDNVDTYVGLMLGYYHTKVSNDIKGGKSLPDSEFKFAGFAGARYYFTDNWAIMGELATAPSVFNLGVAYRF